MSKHLTPTEVAVALLGNIATVAEATNLNEKTIYNWHRPAASRDAGDIPSARQMRHLMSYSTKRKLGLKPEHLIAGAPQTEITSILEARGDVVSV